MRFISVRRLAAFFKLEFSRVDDELVEKLRVSIDQHFLQNSVLIAFGQRFNQKELIFIINQLKEDEIRVFHDWIENDRVLVEYLFSKGESILLNEEIISVKEPNLLPAYQEFVSTFLTPILFHKTNQYIAEKDLNELSNHLRFGLLLTTEKRIEIQKPINAFLKQLLAQTKVSQDKELHKLLNLVFSDEFVELLNELDDFYYQDVLSYFNTAKLIVQRNDLSPMLLNRVKSALTGLNLKEEDQLQAQYFVKANTFTSRSKSPSSNLDEMVKSPFFFIAVLVVIIYFVFLYDWGGGGKAMMERPSNVTEPIILDSFPIIVDTFTFEAFNRKLEERSFSNYHPLYFGKKRDTLYVDYDLASYAFGEANIFQVLEDKKAMQEIKMKADLFNKKRDTYSNYYKDLNFHLDSIPATWEEAKIKITIDTSQIIRNIGRAKFRNTDFVYNAYPVMLENLSDSTILIGYGSQIPIIMESKDKNGDWVALEYQYTYPCSSGLPSITLPKNEMILTSVAIIDFDNKKDLRLRIGENLSEVFVGGKK